MKNKRLLFRRSFLFGKFMLLIVILTFIISDTTWDVKEILMLNSLWIFPSVFGISGGLAIKKNKKNPKKIALKNCGWTIIIYVVIFVASILPEILNSV